jgi:hypothetical protein
MEGEWGKKIQPKVVPIQSEANGTIMQNEPKINFLIEARPPLLIP